MTLVGELSLWVALMIAAWSAAVSFLGYVTDRRPLLASGARGIRAVAVLLLISTAALVEALLSRDFALRHVAHYTSSDLLPAYAVAALWVGGAGALLFCTTAVALAAATVQTGLRRRDPRLAPVTSGFLGMILCFLLAILVFRVQPFAHLEWIPPDGRGLHPLLQHPAVLVHPPLVWISYALSAVPFALIGCAVVRGRLDLTGARTLWGWMLALWIVLTAAILTGLWWSYFAFGWSERWPVHPIDNGSLLPWLATTAFLIAVRRGSFGRWSLILPAAAFTFSIVAALATSAGLFAGGPAFVAGPGAFWILALISVSLLVSGDLIRTRLQEVYVEASRRGHRSSVFFALGALLMLAGIAGTTMRRSYDLLLRPGEDAQLAGHSGEWRLVSEGISRYNILNRHVLAVTLATYRGEDMPGIVSAERVDLLNRRGELLFQHASRPGLLRTFREDAYVVLAGVPDRETADLRVTLTPLVSLVWLGGIVLLLSGALALSPARPEAR